jgi:intergrase/recombinase
MAQLSYRRHRFPAEIIQHAIWLYLHLRFTLSYRDVEELLAERGLDVSYETVRRWVLKIILTSQVPVDKWHAFVGGPTYADAVLERLVHNAHRIDLTDDSLRRRRSR